MSNFVHVTGQVPVNLDVVASFGIKNMMPNCIEFEFPRVNSVGKFDSICWQFKTKKECKAVHDALVDAFVMGLNVEPVE